MKQQFRFLLLILCLALPFFTQSAQATEATLAGFAFAGDYKTAPERFPYSFKIFEKLKTNHASLSALVTQRCHEIKNPNIELTPIDSLVNVKKSDQALMVVLVLTDEVVSSENYGTYYKTFVNLRGNLLIFDYKAHAVIRTYPLNTVIFDATQHQPSEARIQSFVENLLTTQDKQGLISLFTQRLAIASLPQEGSKSLQVKHVEIDPRALAQFPKPLQQKPNAAATMVADSFASILSERIGVPLLPNSIGAIDGVMMMRLENGDDYRLKVGDGDYLFDLRIKDFIKKKTESTSIGIAYIYGVYSDMHFYEPTLNTDFIKTSLKNGESAVVPASQVSSDDFPGYKDAINGLYWKFSNFLANGAQTNRKWLKAAASAEDIEAQIETARDILRKCK